VPCSTVAINSAAHHRSLHSCPTRRSSDRSARRHLAPGARLVLDVFNPSVRLLAGADGVRRSRESLSFTDPHRGQVNVEVAERYRSEEHTSELQSRENLVCRLLLENKNESQ